MDGGTLVILGWFTQLRLVSDMHMHNVYISRTVISHTETNKSNVQSKMFLLHKVKMKKESLLGVKALLKPRSKF